MPSPYRIVGIVAEMLALVALLAGATVHAADSATKVSARAATQQSDTFQLAKSGE